MPNFLITLVIGSIGWTPYGRVGLVILLVGLFIISVVMPFLKFKYESQLDYLAFLLGFLVLSGIFSFGAFLEKCGFTYAILFIISLALTVFWASMIMYKSFSTLKYEEEGKKKKEKGEKKKVLEWLETEGKKYKENEKN